MEKSGDRWQGVVADKGDGMLEGCGNVTVDAKGRIVIPAAFRASVGRQVVLTTHYASPCLVLFSADVWAETLAKIQALPTEAANFRRHMIGNANRIETDEQSRIVIPPRLRRLVGLEKVAIVRGLITHCEIWDEATLDGEEAASMALARRQIEEYGVPRGMSDFAF